MGTQEEALAWQTRVWVMISDVYLREIDFRFAPVASHSLTLSRLFARLCAIRVVLLAPSRTRHNS